MNNILITLCARGGSKGIPGKNIKLLYGKPLIDYTIQHALRFAEIIEGTEIALSTDSEEIKKVAEECGLTTKYQRPDFLANDTAGKVDVLYHILQHEEEARKKSYDYVLDLDVTSPLRTVDELLQAFEIIKRNKTALNIFSVSKAHKNPYFNMVERKDDGFYKLAIESEAKSRQVAPVVYEMNASFYFYRKEFFIKGNKSAITKNSLVFLMDHICFDLDEPLDFDIMDFLISNNKLDFKL